MDRSQVRVFLISLYVIQMSVVDFYKIGHVDLFSDYWRIKCFIEKTDSKALRFKYGNLLNNFEMILGHDRSRML